MANTYTQIYIHFVFATERRMRFLTPEIRQETYSYLAGCIKDLKGFVQCIGGMDDHIHILVGMPPTLSVSEFAQKVKANSSRFINEKGWVLGKFKWQEGFGAFSVSQSGLENTREYIQNQENHHRKHTFSNEYIALLTRYEIKYDSRYVFHDPVE